MSITTASICLSKYLGLPMDIANCIVRYAGTSKWIPQYDTKGKLYKKVNPRVYGTLSRLCYMHPAFMSGLNTHSVVLNSSIRYDTARTFVQRRHICNNGDLHITLYTMFEVSPDVFNYLSITYMVSPSSIPIRQFVKGVMHLPLESLLWNKQRTITTFDMVNDVMYVNHSNFQMEYIWNEELNIGEYIMQGHHEYDDDYEDDDDDDNTWAL